MSTRLHGAQAWFVRALLLLLAASAPVAAQDRTVVINGETLHYRVAGDGAPLVLIHGWSLNLGMWDRQEAAFARKYRVVRYDRRGFGASSGGEDITWDAADLTALLDTLGIAKAHVVGLSQGARIALQFARTHPERVSSLVLHGAPLPDGFGLPWTGPDRPRFDEWGTLAREQGMDAFRRVWSAHPLMVIPADRPDARALLTEQLAAYGGGRFLKPTTPSGPVKPITADDLSRIDVPTLVLIGESETPYLQMAARALAYYVPGATLTVIPGGGHLINMIEPARYNTAVLNFLAGVQKRAR